MQFGKDGADENLSIRAEDDSSGIIGNPDGGPLKFLMRLEFAFLADFGTDDYAVDVGLGLRLDLPIGPIRIDYGIPVKDPFGGDKKGKFNFNVGYQF